MKKQTRGASQRQLRVGEQIKHVIAETLQRGHFHDEILLDAGRVTVTEVKVTPNLKIAKAYVMPLGGINYEEVLEALNKNASYFQKEINHKTNLKFTPKVSFVDDPSFAQAEHIENLLRSIPKSTDQ